MPCWGGGAGGTKPKTLDQHLTHFYKNSVMIHMHEIYGQAQLRAQTGEVCGLGNVSCIF